MTKTKYDAFITLVVQCGDGKDGGVFGLFPGRVKWNHKAGMVAVCDSNHIWFC